MKNNLEFWIRARARSRAMLGVWNKRRDRKAAGETLATLSMVTRYFADEIRRVERQLGRSHRYLPKSGIYQGRIL